MRGPSRRGVSQRAQAELGVETLHGGLRRHLLRAHAVELHAEQLALLPKNVSNPDSYTVVVNELGNGIETILETIALLKKAGGFEIVLPEVLLQKLTTNTKSQKQCPLASGPWSEQAGDLPKCWLPDDNMSCVMTCDTINVFEVPVRCDLNVCSNIRLSKSNTEFECVETGKVCPAE